MKIRKDHTTFLQFESERTNQHHKGIFVDIFPADQKATGFLSARLQYVDFALSLLFNRGYASEAGGVVGLCEKILLRAIPRRLQRKLSNWSSERSRRWNNNQTTSLVFPCTIRDCKRFYPADLFDHLEKLSFNGKEYHVVRDRDVYLQIRYGDYMQLPPEEERVWKHQPILVDFEHNYEELETEV